MNGEIKLLENKISLLQSTITEKNDLLSELEKITDYNFILKYKNKKLRNDFKA